MVDCLVGVDCRCFILMLIYPVLFLLDTPCGDLLPSTVVALYIRIVSAMLGLLRHHVHIHVYYSDLVWWSRPFY